MTEIESEPLLASSDKPDANPWDAEFARLRSRFPKAKDPVLFCVHVLQQSADVVDGDLKARAALHGIRVTGQSIRAAQRLLLPATKASAVRQGTASKRSQGAPAADYDFEGAIRRVVEKARDAGSEEVKALQQAIRRAIAVLEAALRE